MKLEVQIQPPTPIARETLERTVSARLERPESDADEVVGRLGWAGRCRVRLRFLRGRDHQVDRTRVESIDLTIESDDPRDEQAVGEWCGDLARALDAPLRAPDGRPLDASSLSALVRASRRSDQLGRAALAAVALVALLVGGLCLRGFETADPLGQPDVQIHVRLTGLGMASCVVGVALATIAIAPTRARRKVLAPYRVPSRCDTR